MVKYVEYYGAERVDTFLIDDNTNHFTDVRRLRSVDLLRITFWKSLFLDMFMPRGYPQSVSPDYISYQFWDTVQAFASSVNGALATEALLRGAGVGDEVIMRGRQRWPLQLLGC